MSYALEQPLVGQQKIWEAFALKDIIEECITEKRFQGLAEHITNISFFWSRTIPTACAGHGFIFFNPDFFDSIPEETRKTVVAHEILHLILKHLQRGEKSEPQQYNIAADHVINNILLDEGFTFEGTTPLADPKYKNMSTEEVYNIIYEDTPDADPNHVGREQIEDMIKDALAQQGKGSGQSALDDQKKKAEEDVDNTNKGIGSSPGNIPIFLRDTKKRTAIEGASYGKIFANFLTEPLSGGKRTFMRPNRRQHGISSSNLRLPGRYPKRGHINRLAHLVYALDVSGSIDATQAQQFHDSARTIKEVLNPEKFTILFFDTLIQLEKTFTDKQKYKNIKVNAGGGTDLKAVYQRTAEIKPEALVIFTDLGLGFPAEQNWETIWLVPQQTPLVEKVPYGEVYLIPEK